MLNYIKHFAEDKLVMEQPLVCLIIIDFNDHADTYELLTSLGLITYSNYKILVIDNGSDIPLELEDTNLNNVELYFTGDNLGFAGGNNFAITIAMEKYNPDFFLLINNDTVVEADFLDKLIGAAARYDRAAILSGKIMYYANPNTIWYAGGDLNLKNGWTRHFGVGEIDKGQYDNDKLINFATGCMWLLPRWTVEKVGLLSQDYFLYFEDTDYCMKVKQQGFDIVYCPAAKIYHKVSASSQKNSRIYTYYYTRNSLYFVKQFGTSKIIAYIQHVFQFIKDNVKGGADLKTQYIAIRDFLNGDMGKGLL